MSSLSKYTYVVLTAILLVFCEEELKSQFTLELVFYPSYLPVSTINVNGINEGNYIKVKGENFSDSAQINSKATEEIASFFKNYLIKNDTNSSVLEPHIKGHYSSGDDNRLIEFNAPKKGDQAHVLLQRLYSIMYDVLNDRATITYLEKLEQQFDFGLGIKTLNDDPLTYKLYGKITAHKSQEFQSFVNSIPSDKEVIIDMINFESMGRVFYRTIGALMERNPNIMWINCNRMGRVHLLNSRVPEDHVILKDK